VQEHTLQEVRKLRRARAHTKSRGAERRGAGAHITRSLEVKEHRGTHTRSTGVKERESAGHTSTHGTRAAGAQVRRGTHRIAEHWSTGALEHRAQGAQKLERHQSLRITRGTRCAALERHARLVLHLEVRAHCGSVDGEGVLGGGAQA